MGKGMALLWRPLANLMVRGFVHGGHEETGTREDLGEKAILLAAGEMAGPGVFRGGYGVSHGCFHLGRGHGKCIQYICLKSFSPQIYPQRTGRSPMIKKGICYFKKILQ